MPGFDGTGPRGTGPMTGGGRGFCSPWGIGATSRPYGRFQGRGYGYHRWGYGYPYYGAVPTTVPFAPSMTREQEIDLLKSQAQAVKSQLEQIESRIEQLGSDNK
jgi:hypothetical protein